MVYAKIRKNDQKLLFWPFFAQKWPKIPTFWPKNNISNFDMTGVYLYVFWDEKFIDICENSYKLPETTFLAIFWQKMTQNPEILAKKENFPF